MKKLQKYVEQKIQDEKNHLATVADKNGHGPRWIQNRVDKLAEKLDRIANAGPVDRVQISVEWKRSKTWGMNPTANAVIISGENVEYYTGSASGCGYDKESAAIAEALNQSPSILRLCLESYIDKGVDVYGADATGFHGGVGVGCFRRTLEAMGYDWQNVGTGKTFDCYIITKKGRK